MKSNYLKTKALAFKTKISEKTVAPIFEMVVENLLRTYEKYDDKENITFEDFCRELLAKSKERRKLGTGTRKHN